MTTIIRFIIVVAFFSVWDNVINVEAAPDFNDPPVKLMDEKLPEGLENTVKKVLSSPSDVWWTRNLSESYPWLKGKSLFWIIDGETGESVVALQNDSKTWDILNSPSSLKILSNLLHDHINQIVSSKVDMLKIADVIRELYQDPRGHICDQEFIRYNEEMGLLGSFIINDKNDQAKLKSFCKNPDYHSDDNKNWVLDFNVLNRHGGIDTWKVVGYSTPFSIESINIDSILPDNSFYYPDEL